MQERLPTIHPRGMLAFAVRHRENGQINPRMRVLGEYWEKHVHCLLMQVLQVVCYIVERVYTPVDAYMACSRKEETSNSKEDNKMEVCTVAAQPSACTSCYVCACTRKHVSSIQHVAPIKPIDQHDYDT